jgi:hypothetical protein
MMLDRLLYLLVALALAAVCIFDPIFLANLFRMMGQPLELLPLNTLEAFADRRLSRGLAVAGMAAGKKVR